MGIFTKQINKDFYIQNNRIHLTPEYISRNQKYFKKITGSRFFSILGESKFSSPVKTWAQMVNIYKEEIDPTIANAGCTIEPMVRSYVEKHFDIKFKFWNPSEINFDCFHENEIFGGIPDGEPIDSNGNLAYDKGEPMLEIKTSSADKLKFTTINNNLVMQKDANGRPIVTIPGQKRKEWFDENGDATIPKEYVYQLALYLYLRNAKKGLFAVCFLKPEDYMHPEQLDINKADLIFVEMDLENHKWIYQEVEKAKQWYLDHMTKNYVSPELNYNDIKWLEEHYNAPYNTLTKK